MLVLFHACSDSCVFCIMLVLVQACSDSGWFWFRVMIKVRFWCGDVNRFWFRRLPQELTEHKSFWLRGGRKVLYLTARIYVWWYGHKICCLVSQLALVRVGVRQGGGSLRRKHQHRVAHRDRA